LLRSPLLLLLFALAAAAQTSVPDFLKTAALQLDAASAILDESERAAKLDEVQVLYLKANSLDPTNVDVLYHLGMISWMKVFPAVVAARREIAMEPETPGPLRNRSARAVLNARYRADIDYSIATLEQAVALDPTHSDAMALLQMAYRARADFKDTRAQWDQEQASAGSWRAKAFDVGTANLKTVAAPSLRVPRLRAASAIFVDSATMARKLIHFTVPPCPSGYRSDEPVPIVTLSALIDKDGSVLTLERSDGPAELVPSAIAAAQGWTYRPTLLNGEPTQVATTIQVAFSACPQN
jgi:hypothetical protein